MKVKYDEIVKYQDEFKERLPSDKAIEYIALSPGINASGYW